MFGNVRKTHPNEQGDVRVNSKHELICCSFSLYIIIIILYLVLFLAIFLADILRRFIIRIVPLCAISKKGAHDRFHSFAKFQNKEKRSFLDVCDRSIENMRPLNI